MKSLVRITLVRMLAAVVPKPRVNLTRYHGVFAPNSRLREQVTPGRRAGHCRGDAAKVASERHAAMNWAQHLKRVFRIDIETCRLLEVERCYRYIGKADLQKTTSEFDECPQVADFCLMHCSIMVCCRRLSLND